MQQACWKTCKADVYFDERRTVLVDIQFDCSCGDEISEFTRGGPDGDVRVRCENCESRYVVTITKLLDGAEL